MMSSSPQPQAPLAVAGLRPQPVFVGRESELATLRKILDPNAGQTGWVLITGLAGVGKTALATEAAMSAVGGDWFPGGTLMFDLLGYEREDDQALPANTLNSLLSAIGIADEHIPPDLAAKERLWRSVLAERDRSGRRMLIIADNASSAAQVRPVLPGWSTSHCVIVTSRHSLVTLDGVRVIELDELPIDEALRLLRAELVAANPDDPRGHGQDAERVVRLCANLPLAVRIAAAHLAAEPDLPVSELVSALTGERDRLEELRFDGSLAVRAAFDLSYDRLTPTESRMFRILALNPGPEISTEAAAFAADVSPAHARRLISQLRRAHLVTPGTTRGRWRLHDLLRIYAWHHANRDPELQGSPARLFDYYRGTAKKFSLTDYGTGEVWREGVAWFDRERHNLLAILTVLSRSGDDSGILDIGSAILPYLHDRTHWNDTLAICLHMIPSAERLKDLPHKALVLSYHGWALYQTGHFDEALDCFRGSMEIHQETGNRTGEADDLGSIGLVLGQRGLFEEALSHHRRALQLWEADEHVGQSVALNNIGITLQDLGKYDEAITCHLRALELVAGTDDRQYGIDLNNLATAYRDIERYDEAFEHYARSLESHRTFGDQHGEADTLTNLGTAHRRRRELDDALECYTEALALYHDINDKHGMSIALGNYGKALLASGRAAEAVDAHLRQLGIAQELGDRRGEAFALRNVGVAYHHSSQRSQAITHLRDALSLFESLPGADAATQASKVTLLLAEA